MESLLYPMKLKPIFKDKIWGGNKIKTHLAELGTIEDDVIIFVLQLLDDLEMLKKQCLLSKFPELLGTIFVTPYEKLEDSVSENILKEYLGEPLPDHTYEAVGPHFQNNPYSRQGPLFPFRLAL